MSKRREMMTGIPAMIAIIALVQSRRPTLTSINRSRSPK